MLLEFIAPSEFNIISKNMTETNLHSLNSPSVDSEGGGGAGSTDPPGKSQVIWVSIGNKQLDPPLEKVGPPWKMLDPLRNDSFL